MVAVEKFSVVFHGMEPSDAVRQRALVLLERLERVSPSLMHGRMTIDLRHKHHHQGNVFHVSLRLHLPGHDVLVSHEPDRNHAHEDVYVAMRDACDGARKQLLALEHSRSGKGVQHESERFDNRPERQPE